MRSLSRSAFLYTLIAERGPSWVALVENDLFPKSLKDFERGVFADSVRVNFSPTVDCKLIPQTTKNTLHPRSGWTMVVKLFCIVKLRRYLKTATFFVNEASANPEIQLGESSVSLTFKSFTEVV